MRTVHKFPLHPGQRITLPEVHSVRHVADQFGTDCAWIELDLNCARAQDYTILKAGTGHTIPPAAMYLGTVLESHGQYVWHYYAVPA